MTNSIGNNRATTMSSPLSSLSKSKRSPLQRNIPFRTVYDIDEMINTDLEKCISPADNIPEDCVDLVNDVVATPHYLLDKRKSHSKITKPTKPDSTPTDMDLMSSMMGRLSQLQLRNQFHEKELVEKDSRIKTLEKRIKFLENVDRAPATVNTKVRGLEKENQKLRRQLYDIEEFLADYGMMWLGQDSSDSENETESKIPIKSLPNQAWKPDASVPGHLDVNYDLILENIRDLNVLAGEGETKIHKTLDGAKLKLPDPVQLSLYANGILMFNGPFRPFTDPLTQICIKDLTDGYFPTELQKRYPEGCLFSVHDYRNLQYEEKTRKAFTGQGQVLGGNTKPSRLVPSNLNYSQSTNTKQDSTHKSHIKGISKDQFLSKLPSNVVKSGKVIDIRQAVSDMIRGESSIPNNHRISVVETSVTENLRKSASSGTRGGRITELSPDECTTLRIKHLDKTLVLVLKNSDTIGDVRQHLSEHSKDLITVKYDLLSPFPMRRFEDNSVTLLNAGLSPNALLHLQVKK